MVIALQALKVQLGCHCAASTEFGLVVIAQQALRFGLVVIALQALKVQLGRHCAASTEGSSW